VYDNIIYISYYIISYRMLLHPVLQIKPTRYSVYRQKTLAVSNRFPTSFGPTRQLSRSFTLAFNNFPDAFFTAVNHLIIAFHTTVCFFHHTILYQTVKYIFFDHVSYRGYRMEGFVEKQHKKEEEIPIKCVTSQHYS
jgi:hypothetical protein